MDATLSGKGQSAPLGFFGRAPLAVDHEGDPEDHLRENFKNAYLTFDSLEGASHVRQGSCRITSAIREQNVVRLRPDEG